MANPTSQVQSVKLDYRAIVDRYWPIPSTADTYQTNEMLGVNPSTGNAGHFDDSQVWLFLGLMDGVHKVIDSTTPTDDDFIRYALPRYYSMPLNTGTASRSGGAIGSAAYAADSGHVGLTATTNSNLAGMVIDILAGDFTTMTGATNVLLAPPTWGALLGLVCQGIPAFGTNGNAAPLSITGGPGAGNGTGASISITAGASAGNTGTGGSVSLASGAAAGGTAGAVNIQTVAAGKLGFFNATAVVLYNSTGNTATGAAGSTTTVFLNTTFTGGSGNTAYTVGDIVKCLKAYGLMTA